MVTLDDFVVGIDYNKEPYTQTERFAVITPDMPSQHKFFTVDNYTHRYLNRHDYDKTGASGFGRTGGVRGTSNIDPRAGMEKSGYAKGEGQYNAMDGNASKTNLGKAGAACMNYNKSARGKYMTNSLYETKPFKMPGPLTKRCFACTFQEDVAKTCKIPTISYVRVRKMPNGEMVKLTNEGYSRTTYGGFYAK